MSKPFTRPVLSQFTPWRNIFLGLLIVGAAFLIYWPALRGALIGDDVWYILRNPVLRDPSHFWRIWFAPGSWVEFYPIEQTILSLEWQLWHIDTLGYHLTTLCLHILNALLVWHLLRKLGLPLAWLGGLIFAIHPEQVDSVAQVAELKNTLSLSPFIVAMCFYLDYDRTHARRSYLWAVAAFLAAMLCKITMAPFPLLILLYAWWKRGRVSWDDVRASLPFAVIALVLGMMTIWAGNVYGHSLDKDWQGGEPALGGFFFRLLLCGQTLAYYFSRCVWPLHPVPVYPQWPVEPAHLVQWLPWLAILFTIGWFWHRRNEWGRHALMGLGFFTLFLLPFLGFHSITYMRATWVMDHMLYIPIIGLIGLLVAALGDLRQKLPASARIWGGSLLAVGLALLSVQSNVYAGKFTNAETLERYALQLYPNNGVLHYFLGSALQDEHDYAGAITQFRIALRWSGPEEPSGNGPIHAQLGDILLQAHRPSEAVAEYQRALQLHYQPVEMMVDEGTALVVEGQPQQGLALLRQAVRIDPTSATAQYNLAKALCLTGQVPEGIERYREAIRLRPGYAEAHNNLGITLARQGQNADALREFRLALDANPSFVNARRNLEIVQSIVTSPSAAR